MLKIIKGVWLYSLLLGRKIADFSSSGVKITRKNLRFSLSCRLYFVDYFLHTAYIRALCFIYNFFKTRQFKLTNQRVNVASLTFLMFYFL